MPSRLYFALAVAALLPPSIALAQGLSAPASIQARQANYRETGTAFKAINDELRKSAPGRFIMASSARRIAANLRQVGAFFPAGSGPAAGVKTRARNTIWNNRATFDRLNGVAVVQADGLVAAMRGTDVAAIRIQAQALGRACKACHDQFRIED